MTTSNRFLKAKILAATAAMTASTLLLAGCTSTNNRVAATSAGGNPNAITAAVVNSTTGTSAGTAADTEATIADTVAAAEEFLTTLNEEQKATLVYDYNDETKSTSWSNFPVTFVERAGLNLHDLTEEQQQAALKVLQGLLNEEAYQMAVNIMAGDQHLLDYAAGAEDSLGQYYIAFFGDPSTTEAWSLQFGGHHLGVNADLNGRAGIITFAPTHLGSQPYSFTNEAGETITTMDALYTDAFAFYDSLTQEQLSSLYQGNEVPNLSCAPGSTCEYTTGEGIAGSELTTEQRELLLEVIRNWAGMADDASWAAHKAAIVATMEDTYVSWSGATSYDPTTGNGIYFTISGPNVYIEFSSQDSSTGTDVDGEITAGWGHVHSIYRDPTNDYAGSVTQEASSGPGAGGPGMGRSNGTPPAGVNPRGQG